MYLKQMLVISVISVKGVIHLKAVRQFSKRQKHFIKITGHDILFISNTSIYEFQRWRIKMCRCVLKTNLLVIIIQVVSS